MDIALMSMAMNQANVMQQASMSVLKMSMDQTGQGLQMLTSMQQASAQSLQHVAQPHLGGNIDIKI